MPKHSKGWKEMNPKKRKFVREVAKHGNLTQAAMEAYNHKRKTSAASHGSQLMKQDDVKLMLRKALDVDKGMDLKSLLEKKKKLISQGEESLGQQKVTPELYNKTLDSVIDLYKYLGESTVSKGNSSNHKHIHLHNAPRNEVIEAAKKSVAWFEDIAE